MTIICISDSKQKKIFPEKPEEILQNIENITELEELEIRKKKRLEEYSNKLKQLEEVLEKNLKRLQDMTSEERSLYYDEKVKKINESIVKEQENIKKLKSCNYIHNPNIIYKIS